MNINNVTLVIVGMAFGGLCAYGYARVRQKQKEQWFLDLLDDGKVKDTMTKMYGKSYRELKQMKKKAQQLKKQMK